MKTLKKIVDFFKKKQVKEANSKKDANLNYNGTLAFQFSLMVSMITIALIINGSYAVKTNQIAKPLEEEPEVIWISDFVIVEPKKEEPVIQKQTVKKINPTIVQIVDKPIVKDIEIEKDPEPKEINSDKPVVIVPEPKHSKKEPDIIHSFLGVERVPVFPGCEALTDNRSRRDCMSSEIGRLINKHFNTEIANELGLTGTQKIYVSFVINKKGEVDQLQVRAPHPRLEKEAGRVVSKIPKMLPGIQNNQEVEVRFSLPIMFNVVH
ncbi:energy transducer TonB [uncultured Planktosalinus sp.]|uniref:energy transducer TonB n=1 Tax=uncultured Planktosalinus sp. TaxID=1810935 RepID=UPI0030D96EE7